PDIYRSGKIALPRGTLHITRTKLLCDSTCFETVKVSNYGLFAVDVPFSVEFGADFVDIFEVRGMRRPHRGSRRDGGPAKNEVIFAYHGLDGVTRRTRIRCSPDPESLAMSGAFFRHTLQPKEAKEFLLSYGCEIDGVSSNELTYGQAHYKAEESLKTLRSGDCGITP